MRTIQLSITFAAYVDHVEVHQVAVWVPTLLDMNIQFQEHLRKK